MQKILFILGVVAVIVVGFVVFSLNDKTEYDQLLESSSVDSAMPVVGSDVEEMEVIHDDENLEPEESLSVSPLATTQAPSVSVGTQVNQPQVREFNIGGTNFEFSLGEIRVRKGNTVKINFVAVSGFHDWVIDEFNARTKQLSAGGSETVTFVADKAGVFEYYCSVGSHRQMGMKGNLIIE